MTGQIVIGWHRIAWQMVRCLCGPNRAVDHELARRFARARAKARAAYLAERLGVPHVDR